MKKSYLIALAFAVLGFGIITAFSDEGQSPEEKEQMEKIQKMLESKLDSFRMVKEGECEARALEAAIMRADSIMSAPKTTTKKNTSAPTPKKVEPTNSKDKKMSGKNSNVEDKNNKMSGKSAEESKAKKDAKMGGGGQ